MPTYERSAGQAVSSEGVKTCVMTISRGPRVVMTSRWLRTRLPCY